MTELDDSATIGQASGRIVFFGGTRDSETPASALDASIVGARGLRLIEMARLDLPTPPGFIIPVAVMRDAPSLAEEILRGVAADRLIGKTPLLLHVSAGGEIAANKLFDPICLGFNAATIAALGNGRFAWRHYLHFIQRFCELCFDIDPRDCGLDDTAFHDEEATPAALQALAQDWLAYVQAETGQVVPDNIRDQLVAFAQAHLRLWESDRAQRHRDLFSLSPDQCPSLVVQRMVLGNFDDRSAVIDAASRDPRTGAPCMTGGWQAGVAREEFISGERWPLMLDEARADGASDVPDSQILARAYPDLYATLQKMLERLERHERDAVRLTCVVESGRLWIVDSAPLPCSIEAQINIAVDMVDTDLLDREAALLRISPLELTPLLHPTLRPNTAHTAIARGLPAAPGAASGVVVLTAEDAHRCAAAGDNVILVCHETSPEDVQGMHAACGILTARGGMTSHAAMVARGMGRPCVTGVADMRLNMDRSSLSIGPHEIHVGDEITIDGGRGEVFLGALPMTAPELGTGFARFMAWADEQRRLKVRANADTPEECRVALSFGAQGVGLCRTEHMFFEADRIQTMRQMILEKDAGRRRDVLKQLASRQRDDFREIFSLMVGEDGAALPVTIRLLDPPLHEFLPHGDAEIAAAAAMGGMPVASLKERVAELRETNPMLGHRGCRLGITCPEIYEMQARAIFEAACADGARHPVALEIMVPFVMTRREFDLCRAVIDDVARDVCQQRGCCINYRVGTMIELPRAAMAADEIARSADFFSFGTNDLTQTVLGISRDDAMRFLSTYIARDILATDPFVSLDIEGVGRLMAWAAEKGRAANADLGVGVCGEHGGDPASINFCEQHDFDYVSCSPFRVPVARLAAAQAAIRRTRGI